MMGKRKRDGIPDPVVKRIDFLGINLLGLGRIRKDRDKADQPLLLDVGDIIDDCFARNVQPRLDVEEIGIYGKGGADMRDKVFKERLEEADIPDGKLFDQVFINKDVIIIFKDPEFEGGIRENNFRVSPVNDVFFKEIFHLETDAGVSKIRGKVQALKGQKFFKGQG